MKRSSPMKRGKSLARGASSLKRAAPVRPTGRRGLEDRKALDLVRPVVMERAAGGCERCKLGVRIVGKLDLHHLRSRSQGGTHEASNLAVLCRLCHDDIHAGRAADAGKWIVRRGAGRASR